jgi:hypothetical protein
MLDNTDSTTTGSDQSWLPGKPLQITLIALLLGVVVEVFLDGHALGLGFPLWILFAVAGLLLAASIEGIRPALPEASLAVGVLFFATMAAVRLEPLTAALNVMFALALFALWVRVFRWRRLQELGWIDVGLTLLAVPLLSWVRSWPVWGLVGRSVAGERIPRSTAASVLRGALLALPVLIVFAALLSAADLVFADLLERVFLWLDLEKLLRATRRVVVVGAGAYFCMGAILLALEEPERLSLQGKERPLVRRFLGGVETLVVLVGVDLLFALFVAVQVRYLFGGEANINAAGYTYAEYARRGFGELVAVSALSLGLILTLGMVSKQDTTRERKGFRAASAVLVILISVILASALKRLLLYEDAYGFTRLRTYTHIAIYWMVVLFMVFLAAIFTDNLRRTALAALLTACGFAVTLNLLNVDAFVARRNILRYAASGEVDTGYLVSLSNDAVPILVDWLPEAPQGLREEILPQLACRAGMLEARARRVSWQSMHLGQRRAAAALETIRPNLRPYQIVQRGWRWIVDGPEGKSTCYQAGWD